MVGLAAAKTIAPRDEVGQIERRTIDGGQLGFDLGQGRLQLGQLPGALLAVGRPQQTLAVADAGKHGRHAIIIALRQRIEFVIVAASAVERQPQRGSRHQVDDVVDLVGPGAAAQVGGLGLVPDLVPGPGP